jgi:hypothetical protein
VSDLPESNEPQAPPPLRARIPEKISEGVFSSGVIVITGPTEFVLDFLQNVSRPAKIAARVVIPHQVMPQFLEALKKNVELYTQRFGPLHQPVMPPQPPNARRLTPQEIYDDLKIPDDCLSGVYSNGVMIGHGASEFSLDFLTNFFPQQAVSSRVFLAAGQIPRLIDALQNAVNQLRPPPPDTRMT